MAGIPISPDPPLGRKHDDVRGRDPRIEVYQRFRQEGFGVPGLVGNLDAGLLLDVIGHGEEVFLFVVGPEGGDADGFLGPYRPDTTQTCHTEYAYTSTL